MKKIYQGTFPTGQASLHNCLDNIAGYAPWPSGAKSTVEIDKTSGAEWKLIITVEGENSKIDVAMLKKLEAKIEREVPNHHGKFEEIKTVPTKTFIFNKETRRGKSVDAAYTAHNANTRSMHTAAKRFCEGHKVIGRRAEMASIFMTEKFTLEINVQTNEASISSNDKTLLDKFSSIAKRRGGKEIGSSAKREIL